MKICPQCGIAYPDSTAICFSDGTNLGAGDSQLSTHPPVTGVPAELDEETVVRTRVDPAPGVKDVAPRAPAPALPSSFNPWRIIIPSVAGLLVIFAVIYAFTRNSEPANTNRQETSLITDPNSRPVQPAPPATGKDEQGIPSGGPAIGQTVNPGPSPTASPSATPLVNVNTSIVDVGVNQNSGANANVSRRTGSPAPAPPRQTNLNEQPSVMPSPPNQVPSPKPTMAQPKASQSPQARAN